MDAASDVTALRIIMSVIVSPHLFLKKGADSFLWACFVILPDKWIVFAEIYLRIM